GARRRPIPPEKQLYEAMRRWREDLVNAFLQATGARVNGEMDQVEAAVQRLLDRLIFLRNCEDRGIGEPRLREVFNEYRRRPRGVLLSQRLERVFAAAALTYDSDLFITTSYLDRILPQVDGMASEALGAVMEGLYDPPAGRLAPYDFEKIDADVLGAMYEQYLGHVALRRREAVGRQAAQLSLFGGGTPVEIAPLRRRRKEQGIYYTPRWVVDYIVQQTLGRWLDEHGADTDGLERLAVLDPACGSGSFLIRAYETLLEHHGDLAGGTADHLDRQVREHVLRRNIFGVDLDPQAVEVARLNLLVRMVREEEPLPPLADNILRGNSLISGGEAELRPHFGDAWEAKRPLTWERTFRSVMERGGFNVIIGNPPYIRIQALPEEDRDYYRSAYQSAYGSFDIYVLFIERALNLLKEGGRLGFITSGKFLKSEYGKRLIEVVQADATVEELVDLSTLQVFGDATTYPAILLLRKGRNEQSLVYTKAPAGAEFGSVDQLNELRQEHSIAADQTAISAGVWPPAVGERKAFVDRILAGHAPLSSLTSHIAQGIRTSSNKIFVVSELPSLNQTNSVPVKSQAVSGNYNLEIALAHRFLEGEQIRRYHLIETTKRVLVPYSTWEDDPTLLSIEHLSAEFPGCWAYLTANRVDLEKRERGRMTGDNWYGYIYPKNLDLIGRRKILTRDIIARASFTYDHDGDFAFVSGYAIILHNNSVNFHHYVLGLLNSTLLDFILRLWSTPLQGGYYRTFSEYLNRLPVAIPNETQGTIANRIAGYVARMLELHRRFAAKSGIHDAEWEALTREIRETDQAIDDLVYDLYGLTADERRIVEEEVGEHR
ncbi:MAG: N-6 DNA methylase, partial [Chloroflexi bacterium]|nr:N-6 DNA methylase [Chloroflexota bacterium]